MAFGPKHCRYVVDEHNSPAITSITIEIDSVLLTIPTVLTGGDYPTYLTGLGKGIWSYNSGGLGVIRFSEIGLEYYVYGFNVYGDIVITQLDGSVTIISPTDCTNNIISGNCDLLGNKDFELPSGTPAAIGNVNPYSHCDVCYTTQCQIAKYLIPFWNTDQKCIELWSNTVGGGNNGPINALGQTDSSAYSGTKWVELNAATVAPFYQSFIVPSGGLNLVLGFAHAGRMNCGGNNQMIVKILSGEGSGGTVIYTTPGNHYQAGVGNVYDAGYNTNGAVKDVRIWTHYSVSIPFLSSGIYTLTFNSVPNSDNIGAACGNFLDAITVSLAISVIAASNSPVSVGNTITLTATPTSGLSPFAYQWSGPNSFNNATQNPVLVNAIVEMAGLYTVTMTDANGCIATDSTYVEVTTVPTYIVRDCEGYQTDFVTNTDLSQYVGRTIKTCINSLIGTKSSVQPQYCLYVLDCCKLTTLLIPVPPEPIYTQLVSSGNVITFPNRLGSCYVYEGAAGLTIPTENINWSTAVSGVDYTIQLDCPTCMQNWIEQHYPPCPIPLFYYIFTNCCNSLDIMKVGTTSSLSSASPPVFPGDVVELNNKCWKVTRPDPLPNLPLSIVISPSDVIKTTCPSNPNSLCSCFTWPDGCYCVEIFECKTLYPAPSPNCNLGTPWPGIILANQYLDCPSCLCKSYTLTDCNDDTNVIYTTNDLLIFIGKVIKLITCPDVCWIVSGPFDCTGNEVCIDAIESSYYTCELCLPPVIPPPQEKLHPRRVKPGYYTPGCDPDYTEKINCKFAEAVYDRMVSKRYGLQLCCQEDYNKWFIKKQELDLRAIYDPSLCASPLIKCCAPCSVSAIISDINPQLCLSPLLASAIIRPMCIEYLIEDEADRINVLITDCCGDKQRVSVPSQPPLNIVCSSSYPVGGQGTIITPRLEHACIIPTCFQWVFESVTSCAYEYYDCNGSYQLISMGAGTIYIICGISARLRNGMGTVTKHCKECEPCRCFDINVLIETTCGFDVEDCISGGVNKITCTPGHNYICSPIKPSGSLCIEGVDYTITETINCGDPNSPCFYS